MKLVDLLKEIGDATTRPYYFEIVIDDEDHRVYNFETDSNTYYEVDLQEIEPNEYDPYSIEPESTLSIQFGVTNEKGTKDTKGLTNKGEVYRVMATIVAIVNKELSEHPNIKSLEFVPSKRPGKDTEEFNARNNIYIRYIKSAYPDSDVRIKNGEVLVDLK